MPTTLIKLRYANAIDEKIKKWSRWKAEGKVRDEDGFIIAINGSGIPHADCDLGYPYIVQPLYPVGPFAVNVDRESLEPSTPFLLREVEVKKQNGGPVNTAWFAGRKYAQISAVIHSFAGFSSYMTPLGSDFISINNPLALHPIPEILFSWLTQYDFRENQLTRTEPVCVRR